MSTAPGTTVLPACPDKPNCVCSQASDERHAIAPLSFTGSPERAHAALLAVLRAMPRTRVVLDEPLHLRAECRSLIFRFVDDVELVIDPKASVVHVRSASRTGYSDLGVNRRRVEGIRAALAAELARAD